MKTKTVLGRLLFLTAFSSSLLVAGLSFGEDIVEAKRQQIWEGPLNAGGFVLRLRFEISLDEDDKFSGHIISVDQGNAKIPLTDMSVNGDKVTMEFQSVGGKFVGQRNKENQEVVGTWTQLGKEYDYTIKRVDAESPKTHTETWRGVLQAEKKEYDLQLRIQVDKEGKQYALLDSMSERKLGISAEFKTTKDGFEFRLPTIKASFSGVYNTNKTEIKGDWQQGAKLPLTFKRIPIEETRLSLEKRNRPQHPTEPYPYIVKEVTFRNEADDVNLQGTLTIPNTDKGKQRWPAVVLVTGSGAQDRDETLFEHKPFLVIADHLTRKGIAVLRYDDRGVGGSSGEFHGATTTDFARDAESGIDFLIKHELIDSKQIGIIGHSEGGVIGPMIAARRDDIAFIVMLAGPGITGAEISVSQSRAMSETAGMPVAYVKTQEEALKGIIVKIKQERKPLTEAQINDVLSAISETSEEKKAHIELMASAMKNLTDPWMTNYIMSDPAPDLRKVTCPVLAMFGEKDLQVLPKLNAKAVEKHLTTAGNPDFKTLELTGLNHLFQTAESGQITEYGNIEETFAPAALSSMSDWILERTR